MLHSIARALRLGLQEQGRPAAARRGGRLPAVAARRPAGRRAHAATGEDTEAATADDDAPFAALAFKIMTDPYVGQLTFFRVYSGRLETGTYGLQLHHRQARSASAASSRCTPTSARRSTRSTPATSPRRSACSTRDRRHALRRRSQPIVLETMEFPEPVIRVAIEPKTKADQEKLGIALAQARPGGPILPGPAPTRRPGRRSSPAWASCTWRSSSTG